MLIGIIATTALLLLIFWQINETKKSSLLRIAREEYEDQTVRYEGLVTYQKGPFQEIREAAQVYLSILDGVVCLTSKQRDFYPIPEENITGVTADVQGNRAQVTLRFTDEHGERELLLGTQPERARMIEQSIKR